MTSKISRFDMNEYTKAEAHYADVLRAEALFMVLQYDTSEDGAARIALLAAALEAEIVAQGGNPADHKFFTGESNE